MDAAVCAIFRERTEDDTVAGFATGFFVTHDKLFTAHHSRQLFEPGEGTRLVIRARGGAPLPLQDMALQHHPERDLTIVTLPRVHSGSVLAFHESHGEWLAAGGAAVAKGFVCSHALEPQDAPVILNEEYALGGFRDVVHARGKRIHDINLPQGIWIIEARSSDVSEELTPLDDDEFPKAIDRLPNRPLYVKQGFSGRPVVWKKRVVGMTVAVRGIGVGLVSCESLTAFV